MISSSRSSSSSSSIISSMVSADSWPEEPELSYISSLVSLLAHSIKSLVKSMMPSSWQRHDTITSSLLASSPLAAACRSASRAHSVTSAQRSTSCLTTPSSRWPQLVTASSMMVTHRSGESDSEDIMSQPESEDQVLILAILCLGWRPRLPGGLCRPVLLFIINKCLCGPWRAPGLLLFTAAQLSRLQLHCFATSDWPL